MSTCNLCKLKQMKTRAKKRKRQIVTHRSRRYGGGVDCFETVEKGAIGPACWIAWLMSIPEKCCCDDD